MMLSKPSSPKNSTGEEPYQQRRTIDLGSYMKQSGYYSASKDDNLYEEDKSQQLKNYKGVLKKVHVDITNKYVKIKPMKLYMPNSRLLCGAISIPSLEYSQPGTSAVNVVLSTESKPQTPTASGDFGTAGDGIFGSGYRQQQ